MSCYQSAKISTTGHQNFELTLKGCTEGKISAKKEEKPKDTNPNPKQRDATSWRRSLPASQHTCVAFSQPPLQTHTLTHTSCLPIQALPCGPLKHRAPLSKCKAYKDTVEQKPPRRATFCPAFALLKFLLLASWRGRK